MTNRILSIGDSWATGRSDEKAAVSGGWLDILGIPAELRQGGAGLTAPAWASDVNGVLSKAMAAEADTVILSLGYEDLFLASMQPTSFFESAGIFCAFRKAVTLLHERFGDKLYVIMHTMPLPTMASSPLMEMFNGMLMALAPEGVKFINAADVIDKSCFGEGVYYTEAGHARLAELIKGAVSVTTPVMEPMT